MHIVLCLQLLCRLQPGTEQDKPRHEEQKRTGQDQSDHLPLVGARGRVSHGFQ